MWFELKGDARLKQCASEGCGGQQTWRLEAGGTASNYCSGCKARMDRPSDRHDALKALALDMGRLIRSVDESGEHSEFWTQDGDYIIDGRFPR